MLICLKERTTALTMTSDSTVIQQLVKWSQEDGGLPAFIFRGVSPGNQRVVLSRIGLLRLARSFAAILTEAGIEKGEVVCNTLPNSPERLITDLGLMIAGAVVMNGMVFLADGSDLTKCLKRAECVALVVDPNQPYNVLSMLEDLLIVSGDNAQSREIPSFRKVFHVDCGKGARMRPWLEMLKKNEQRYEAEVSPSDLAYIFTTSGTSGYSKLVPRTHGMLVTMGNVFHDLLELKSADILHIDKSLGWLGSAYLVYVAKGNVHVLTDQTVLPNDPLAFSVECCIAEHCAVMDLTPLQLIAITARRELWKDNKFRLRSIVTGGMPLSKQHISVVGLISTNLIITYASAEAGFIAKHKVTLNNKDHFEDGENGKVVGDYKLKIVDDRGEEIQPSQVGKMGEVLLQGSQLFDGYMPANSISRREAFTEDGWLKTKDIAYYNYRGNIHLVCRKSNAIMHGASIIYPGWLEKKLMTCPGIRKALVVPVPDLKTYQELCACIVPEKGEPLNECDVRMFCESLYNLNDNEEYKHVPRYCVFFDQFPVLPNGSKPDRKKIFAIALEKLNQDGELI